MLWSAAEAGPAALGHLALPQRAPALTNDSSNNDNDTNNNDCCY